MRSILAAALCLSLVHQSVAYVPHSSHQVVKRDAEPDQSASRLSWFKELFKRSSSNERRQEVCYEDDYYTFVSNATFGEAFCQAYLDYPAATVTLPGTSTTTLRTIISTNYVTRTNTVRTTYLTTATVTVYAPGPAKRDNAVVAEGFAQFEALAAAAGSPVDSADLSASFSSACACQTYTGPTVTVTGALATKTLDGFVRQTTTSTVTLQAAGIALTTITVTHSLPTPTPPTLTAVTTSLGVRSSPPLQPSVVAPVSASPVVGIPATPTGLSFSCPSANGTTVSQLVDNERFDYLIMCDYDYPREDTFYAELAYNSFAECAAACSMADAYFDNSFCQVAVYYPTANSDGYNCLLKPATQTGVSTPGVNAAVLQLIALGVGSDAPSGTGTTLPGGFAPQSSAIPASIASSSVSSLMGNGSSTSLTLITPAPIMPVGRAAQAFTAFSTYVSDGTTYSTGSEYSTYFSGNGSWYSIYYNTWSLAWAAATTVVGIGEDSSQVAQTNSTTYSTTHNGDGSYVQVTNTTTVTYTYYPTETVANSTDTIIYSTFASNGSFLTASTTVIYGIATSSNGGSFFSTGGVVGGSGSTPVSVSAFETVFLSTSTAANGPSGSAIVISGGTSGGTYFSTGGVAVASSTQAVVSSTAIAGSTVVSTLSVIVNSGGTNGGSFFSTGGAGGSQPSSSAAIIAPPPVVSVVVSSGGTNGGSFFSTGGAGSQPSSSADIIAPPPFVSVVVSSGGTNGGSFFSTGGAGSQPSSSAIVAPPAIVSVIVSSGSANGGSAFSTGGFYLPSSSVSAPIALPPTVSIIVSSGSTTGGTYIASSGLVPPGSSPSASSSAPISSAPASAASSSQDLCTLTDAYTCFTNSQGLRTIVPIPPPSSSSSGIPGLPSTVPVYIPPVVTTSVSGSVLTSTLSSSSGIPGLPSSVYVYVPPGLTSSSSGLSSSDITSAPASSSSQDLCTETDAYTCFTNSQGLRTIIPLSPSSSGIPASTGLVPVSSASSSGVLPPSSGVSSSLPSSTGSPSSDTILSPATYPSSSVPLSTPSGSASSSVATSSGAVSSPVPTTTIPMYPGSPYYVPPVVPSSSFDSFCDTDFYSCFTNSNGLRTRITLSPTPSGTGSLPSSVLPSSTASLSVPMSSGTGVVPSGTGSVPSLLPPTSIATPSVLFSMGTGIVPPGSVLPSSTGVMSPSPSPSTFPGYNCTLATTTVFTTVTLYGCWGGCASQTPGLTAFGEVPPT